MREDSKSPKKRKEPKYNVSYIVGEGYMLGLNKVRKEKEKEKERKGISNASEKGRKIL